MALLRVPRADVSRVEKDPEYDPKDAAAELATYRSIRSRSLEVFYKGEWKGLREHVSEPARGPAVSRGDWKDTASGRTFKNAAQFAEHLAINFGHSRESAVKIARERWGK